MNKLKVFPSFTLPLGVSDEDKTFFDEFNKAKNALDVLYISFSIFHYKNNQREAFHFVTYPMDWILKYIQLNGLENDPLLKLDYRLISTVDWEDIQTTKSSAELFESFNNHGLGNHGISIVTPIDVDTYCSFSITYNSTKLNWADFKKLNMEELRYWSQKMTSQYMKIYQGTPEVKYDITTRERECLYWLVQGKTDKEIADILSIGKWTVIAHIKSAKYKLGCRNRASIAAKVLSCNIIKLPC